MMDTLRSVFTQDPTNPDYQGIRLDWGGGRKEKNVGGVFFVIEEGLFNPLLTFTWRLSPPLLRVLHGWVHHSGLER